MAAERRWRTRPSILAGQLLASAFTAFFLTFLVGEAASEGLDSITWEGFGLTLVMAFATVSVLVTWVEPSLGARLLFVAGVVLAAFVAVTAESNRAMAVVVLGAPYLISALAMCFGARRLARAAGP